MINTVSGIGGAVSTLPNSVASRGIAAELAGTMGARAAAWVTHLGGHAAADDAGYRPDAASLARGGDIYGIADAARDIAGRVGATSAQEGALQRAIEDYTREAVIAAANAADRAGGPDAAALRAADGPGGVAGPETADTIIASLERATAVLRGGG